MKSVMKSSGRKLGPHKYPPRKGPVEIPKSFPFIYFTFFCTVDLCWSHSSLCEYVFHVTLCAEVNRAIKPLCCSSRKHSLTKIVTLLIQGWGELFRVSLGAESAWSLLCDQSRSFLFASRQWPCMRVMRRDICWESLCCHFHDEM